jgi:hypothetical protein
MKSAEALIDAMSKGLSFQSALTLLPTYELRQCRVYMCFARAINPPVWYCRFRADNICKSPLSQCFTFASAHAITELARRGHGLTSMHSLEELTRAMASGRGGIYLNLTETQYEALMRRRTNGVGLGSDSRMVAAL